MHRAFPSVSSSLHPVCHAHRDHVAHPVTLASPENLEILELLDSQVRTLTDVKSYGCQPFFFYEFHYISGRNGDVGIRGKPGKVGPSGPRGEQGSKGDKGFTPEANVIPGPPGEPGDVGPWGLPGHPGKISSYRK